MPKDRLLPTHFLLAGEVQTPDALEYADFLLTDDRRAPAALDRVLATQGWRRFAEQKTPPVDLTQKRELPYQPAERLQLLLGQYRGGLEPPRDREHQRLTGEYWPGYERAATELDAARQAKERAEADRSWEPGFRRAKDFGLGNEYGVDEEFMALELREGAFAGATGTVKYAPEFRAAEG